LTSPLILIKLNYRSAKNPKHKCTHKKKKEKEKKERRGEMPFTCYV